MESVLSRVTTGADVRRVLNSADFVEKTIQKKAETVTAKTRQKAASMTRNHKILVDTGGICVSKNFDEIARLRDVKERSGHDR